MAPVRFSVVSNAPIGIVDSGFGGLTVARAVLDQLPHEPVVCLGDTARPPYGPKPISEAREYALECLDHLVEAGVTSGPELLEAAEGYLRPLVDLEVDTLVLGCTHYPLLRVTV